MSYDTDAIRRAIDRAVGSGAAGRPTFYAVTGSHSYGFADEDSDVDVRGFHVADGDRYALLDEPAEQIVVNQDGVTAGFEAFPDVELVSYELKKFGRLVSQANFDVLETVCCGEPVLDESPESVRELRALVEASLPLDVPASYVGMARTNYRQSLDPGLEDGDGTRTAKRYLYVLRGLLAARYVLEEGTIEADVTALAEHVLGDTALVEDLVEAKRSNGSAAVPETLAERADEQITALFDAVDAIDPPETVDRSAFRDDVDGWMLTVRGRAESH